MANDSEYLRRLNRNQNIANMAAAANLVQQGLLINQVRGLKAEMEASRDEERAYRFAMWLQSPDGKIYSQWRSAALAFVAELERRDRLWKEAWDLEVAAVISAREKKAVAADRYTEAPQKVQIQYRFRAVVLVAVIILAFGLHSTRVAGGTWSYFAFSLLLAASSGFLVWICLYRDQDFIERERHTASVLRRRRIEHFGFDPLGYSARLSTWSEDAKHLELFERIRTTLINADTEFPSPSRLPALTLPAQIDEGTVALEAHKELLRMHFDVASQSPDDDMKHR